jgi:hypothetical protein
VEENIEKEKSKVLQKFFIGLTVVLALVVARIIYTFYSINEIDETTIGEYIFTFYIFAGTYLVYQVIKLFNSEEKRNLIFWVDKTFFITLLLGIFFLQFSILIKVNKPTIIAEINNDKVTTNEFIKREEFDKLIKTQNEIYETIRLKIDTVSKNQKELNK